VKARKEYGITCAPVTETSRNARCSAMRRLSIRALFFTSYFSVQKNKEERGEEKKGAETDHSG